MTRTAVAIDRVATLVAGIALIALGLALVAWHRGALNVAVPLDLSGFTRLLDTEWWPWAGAGGGLVLVLVGLRWLAAHHRPRSARRVELASPDQPAAIPADAASVANAAGDAMAQQPAVLKATGVASVERRGPTVTVTATVPARGGLRVGIEAADDIAATIAVMLGDAVAVRTVLRVDTKRRHGTVA